MSCVGRLDTHVKSSLRVETKRPRTFKQFEAASSVVVVVVVVVITSTLVESVTGDVQFGFDDKQFKPFDVVVAVVFEVLFVGPTFCLKLYLK